jgi:hypothetical protein
MFLYNNIYLFLFCALSLSLPVHSFFPPGCDALTLRASPHPDVWERSQSKGLFRIYLKRANWHKWLYMVKAVNQFLIQTVSEYEWSDSCTVFWASQCECQTSSPWYEGIVVWSPEFIGQWHVEKFWDGLLWAVTCAELECASFVEQGCIVLSLMPTTELMCGIRDRLRCVKWSENKTIIHRGAVSM